MADSKISAGLYEQYKQWLRDTYGWFQALTYLKNDYDRLVKDRYFQAFVRENNLERLFPEIETEPIAEVEPPVEPPVRYIEPFD